MKSWLVRGIAATIILGLGIVGCSILFGGFSVDISKMLYERRLEQRLTLTGSGSFVRTPAPEYRKDRRSAPHSSFSSDSGTWSQSNDQGLQDRQWNGPGLLPGDPPELPSLPEAVPPPPTK